MPTFSPLICPEHPGWLAPRSSLMGIHPDTCITVDNLIFPLCTVWYCAGIFRMELADHQLSAHRCLGLGLSQLYWALLVSIH